MGPADAVVDRDVDALVGKVIGHGQALQAAPIGQRIADEIHAPYRIGRDCSGQCLTLAGRPARLLAAAHGQVRLAVQAVNLLVVHGWVLRAQQVVQAAIAEPAARLRQFDDPRRQCPQAPAPADGGRHRGAAPQGGRPAAHSPP